jgi:hypothetical protein
MSYGLGCVTTLINLYYYLSVYCTRAQPQRSAARARRTPRPHPGHQSTPVATNQRRAPPATFLQYRITDWLPCRGRRSSAAASDLLSPAPSLKSRLADGDTLYVLFLLSFSRTLVELAALAGYDYVVVDMEHGLGGCHTRILGVQNPGANIITRCAGTKSHTYDESWHRIECHIFTI